MRRIVDPYEAFIRDSRANREETLEEFMRNHARAAALLACSRTVLDRLRIMPKRKPPEAGLAVPAVPPCGPLPKQGGAEAPLELE